MARAKHPGSFSIAAAVKLSLIKSPGAGKPPGGMRREMQKPAKASPAGNTLTGFTQRVRALFSSCQFVTGNDGHEKGEKGKSGPEGMDSGVFHGYSSSAPSPADPEKREFII
jgi:hypothetical protein